MLRIAHLADIHIQDRRREEYAAVFDELRRSLRAEAPTLVVVAGDVFDNKMRASPHNLADVAAFLAGLAEVAPVVLVPGNHDCNQLTPGSLDLLSPLLADHRGLQPPRLTYWRSSGVYTAHGAVWTVIATDGDRPSPEEEARARADQPGAPHICLFHEEVNGALLPNGTVLRGYRLTVEGLHGYDLALGGHIHCRQRFTQRAGYCGSLVQQNVGESHRGHGYILWELTPGPGHAPWRSPPPAARGVDVPNRLGGFVRVEVDAEGRDTTLRPLPSTPIYWELSHAAAAPADRVAELLSEHEAAWGMPPRAVRVATRPGAPPGAAALALIPPFPAGPKGAPLASPARAPAPAPALTEEARERSEMAVAQSAARALESHEELITELLGDDPLLDAVLALHRERFAGARGPARARAGAGARFRLLRFEFDNLYAYGEGNVVDFAALEDGVSGVVAPNHSGKSSLIEALLFALYEEHPRAPTKRDVVRRGAPACRLVLDFELDGRPGRIEKSHQAGRAHSASSQYRFSYGGEDRTQGGTAETLAEIRAMLGGPAAALASSFQLQGGEHGSFIGATPAERKKLLAATLELGSFEPLERAVAKELTAANAVERVLAAQYRGASADGLALEELAERAAAQAATARADELAGLEAAALEAARAAAEAAGGAAAEARAAAKTAAGRRAAATGCEALAAAGGTRQERAEALEAWAAALGEVGPSEREEAQAAAAALASGRPEREPRGPVPSLADCAEAAGAAAEAQTLLRAAQAREAAAEAASRATRVGASRRAAAARRLAEAASALKALEAGAGAPVPGFRPRPAEHAEEPAGIGRPWVGTRGGPRPGRADLLSALDVTAGKEEGALRAELGRLAAAAAAQDRSELARLEALLAGGDTAPERLEVAATEAASALAAAHRSAAVALAEAAAAVATAECLPEATRAAGALSDAEPAPSGEAVASAEETVRRSEAAVAASEHSAAIRARLRPVAGCPGCEAAAEALSDRAGILARRDLAKARAARDRLLAGVCRAAWDRAAETRTAHEAAKARLTACQAASREAQARVAAAVRVGLLAAAAAAADSAAALDRAIDTLDRARHWAAQDEADRLSAAAAVRLWDAEERSARQGRIDAAALELSRAEKEAAEAEASEAAEGPGACQCAEESAAAAAELARAAAAAAAAGRRRDELSGLRLEALGALAWFRAADRAATLAEAAEAAQTASRAADQTAAAAAQAAAEAASGAGQVSDRRRAETASAEARARAADGLAAQLAAEQTRAAAHAEALASRDALKAYRAVLRPTGGIGDLLLERARALLTRRVNEGLRELGARFTITITRDFDVYHEAGGPGGPDSEETWLPASLASGYQRFVLSLAARLAIWRLSTAPRPDALIIDEGFGACDDDYLDALASALEALATAPDAPRLVFVVSHVDALKARLARALEIVVRPGGLGSLIANAGPSETRAVEARAAGGTGPGRPAPVDLPPDPRKAGNVWCGACGQSLRTGWAKKHLASAKHATAVLRASKAADLSDY